MDPATGEGGRTRHRHPDTEALHNLFEIAQAGGAAPEDALRLGVFLSDMTAFSGFNEVYAELVAEPRPARVTVGADLGGWLVEIDGMFMLPLEQ